MADDYRSQQNLLPGIRNNNPGNIKIGDSWQGMVGNDGTFIIFADMGWGIRALGISLTNMINKGYDTITTLISAWSATDQAAYISNVSTATGIDPGDQLGTDPDTIQSLIQAIVNQENGTEAAYVTPADIAAGMALISQGALSIFQAATVQAYNDPTTTFMYLGLAVFGAYALVQILKKK